MSTVWIRFGDKRDYPIVVNPGVLTEVGALAQKQVRGKTACLISHPRIYRWYGNPVERSLKKAGFQVQPILVPEGEATKSMQQAEKIIGRMIAKRADRSSCLIALGGGVVGDLAGFVAATYMRGIEFIQIPTTLLAQVDSSVGGKVAVNHTLGKNLIGAFLQPRLVVTDPKVLKTLTARQFRSGLAEMIKAAIIADAKFFRQLEKDMPGIMALDMNLLSKAIIKSCSIKGAVVEKDETERGLRAILNYGHTFGHALETYHHYQGYTHGEAVSIGMVMAAHLAAQLGICKQETVKRQVSLLYQAKLPIRGKREKVAKIWEHMKTDKKVLAGENNFILTPYIGHARIMKKIPSFSVHRVLETIMGGA
ncbi:3-dehydroquinate synthase [bacterium]|nr:3-dehydroquinate synthase [bacterium]